MLVEKMQELLMLSLDLLMLPRLELVRATGGLLMRACQEASCELVMRACQEASCEPQEA